jgi:hypothetical protein
VLFAELYESDKMYEDNASSEVLKGLRLEKENEMGRTCGMHRTDEKCIQNFGQITSREGTNWET